MNNTGKFSKNQQNILKKDKTSMLLQINDMIEENAAEAVPLFHIHHETLKIRWALR